MRLFMQQPEAELLYYDNTAIFGGYYGTKAGARDRA